MYKRWNISYIYFSTTHNLLACGWIKINSKISVSQIFGKSVEIRIKMSSISYIRTVQTTNAERSKRLDIIHGFRPIYYFSRIFGLMPFSIRYDSNRVHHEPKVHVFDLILFLLFIISSITILDSGFKGIMDVHNLRMPLMAAYVKVIEMIAMISSAIIFGLEMYNRYNLICILTNFNTFDKNVSSISFIMDFWHSWNNN